MDRDGADRRNARRELIQLMVGRELGEQFPRREPPAGGERLRLEHFSVFPPGGTRVDSVSLTVRAGKLSAWADCKAPG